MLRWSHVLAHQERYEDLLAEAEREQLATEPQAASEKRTPVDDRLLAWLGRSLVTLGCRLQAQQGNPSWPCVDLRVEQAENAVDCGQC
ncbi:MAG: hypothetical protein GTO63_31180 [Anaerolineae bacterium]|nr:hypothetical protein [Anaerolineae bacterium]NIN99154.1 hypothetical protein [Anaerolineae bacterium]NIQ81995.1 hypothetical protein [Anaerolineae bacterium]